MAGKFTKGKVYKYDLKGNYLCEYENSAIASFMNNLSVGHMNLHLNGKYSFYRNHIYTRIFYMTLPSELLVNKNIKEVHQYSTDGKYIKTFNSSKDADLEFGVRHGAISMCLNNKVSTAYGFIWRYIKVKKVLKSERKIKYKKIHQYDLNGKYLKTFNSYKEAILEVGISRTTISICANGKKPSGGGYIWKYKKN